jgi:Tfp pilus assembly protein PilN
VLLQGYMTLLLAAGLGLWWLLAQRNIQNAAAALAQLQTQISQTHQEMHQLQEQSSLKSQLLVQKQIIDKLGLPVEMSRMLYTLDQKLPREMSLTELAFDTQEQLRAASTLASGRSGRVADGIDRRLHIRLEGVAPSDDDVANFLSELSQVQFFQDVAMSFSRDGSHEGRVMRDFEITFTVDLSRHQTS